MILKYSECMKFLNIDCRMSKPSMNFLEVLIADFRYKEIVTFLKNGTREKLTQCQYKPML